MRSAEHAFVDQTAISRRRFLQRAAALGTGLLAARSTYGGTQARPLEVLNPRDRVPVSFVIDDSTCLVNMGHFCMPQFAAAWPRRAEYRKPWRDWPREIPDAFVREFLEFCAEYGVRGKYSVVPYPALVGWLDRELPGWSRGELRASLKLVRDEVCPAFDIHPEMITHTRVIDLRTGRPLEPVSPATMENSYPQEKKSVDELAAYLAYALRILKNCDLPCEGITTPGGFGNRVKRELSLAVQYAVRDVYGAEIPHYFKYVVDPGEDPRPRLEHVRHSNDGSIDLTVNVPAGTGDWFGGWDGARKPEPDRYATADGTEGAMVHWIRRGGPAIMLCHWPGMYCNGSKAGFRAFQQVVRSLHEHFADRIVWLKLSEIARYWAVRQLATMRLAGRSIEIETPFACSEFTFRWHGTLRQEPRLERPDHTAQTLRRVGRRVDLRSSTYWVEGEAVVFCVDLPRGQARVQV